MSTIRLNKCQSLAYLDLKSTVPFLHYLASLQHMRIPLVVQLNASWSNKSAWMAPVQLRYQTLACVGIQPSLDAARASCIKERFYMDSWRIQSLSLPARLVWECTLFRVPALLWTGGHTILHHPPHPPVCLSVCLSVGLPPFSLAC